MLIDVGGWCVNAIKFSSPNFGQRPEGIPLSLLVIHNIRFFMATFDAEDVIDLFSQSV